MNIPRVEVPTSGKTETPGNPYRESSERGITQENWLNNLDKMSDSEITAMLDVDSRHELWQEDRKAHPSTSDRQRTEGLRDFGI